MRRTLPLIAFALAAAAACSPAPAGPAEPMTMQVMALDDLRVAAQARSTALAFLRAYAGSPADGGRALSDLVEGLRAREWAHWLEVQHEAFPGTLSGRLQLGHLGPAGPVRSEDGSLDGVVAYGVVVRGSVVFDVTDEQGRPMEPLVRVVDGLIVLVEGADGAFRVLSFDRDGLRLDQFFQVFEETTDRREGVTVELRTLLHLDRWQFGVQITNDTRRPLHVLPGLTALLTGAAEPATSSEPVVTFVDPIPAGRTVEGLVTFAAPAQTDDLDLQIAIESGDGRTTGFVFGVPAPPGSEQAGSPTPTP